MGIGFYPPLQSPNEAQGTSPLSGGYVYFAYCRLQSEDEDMLISSTAVSVSCLNCFVSYSLRRSDQDMFSCPSAVSKTTTGMFL